MSPYRGPCWSFLLPCITSNDIQTQTTIPHLLPLCPTPTPYVGIQCVHTDINESSKMTDKGETIYCEVYCAQRIEILACFLLPAAPLCSSPTFWCRHGCNLCIKRAAKFLIFYPCVPPQNRDFEVQCFSTDINESSMMTDKGESIYSKYILLKA